MKHKSNQAFTSFDFIVTAVSLLVIIAVSGPIIEKNLQSGNIEQAQKETGEIAFALLNSKDASQLRVASHDANASGRVSRSVASETKEEGWMGSTKRDPWGNPYHFRFLRNSEGMPVQIVVWSSGPDKKSSIPAVKVSTIDGMEHMEFASDDVVSFVPVR